MTGLNHRRGLKARGFCGCPAEVIGAFVWLEDIDELSDEPPQTGDGSFASFSQHRLEPRESLLDGIEVVAVGRKEAQGCAGCFDPLAHRCSLVARQIVHDHDIARSQLGYEDLRHISLEPVAVDRTIEHHWRNHAGHAHTGDQRGRLAMAMGKADAQALASGAAAMAVGHIGDGPRLVDEHETLRLQIKLPIEPVVPLPQDVGAILLDRVPRLFLRVIPRRSKNRHKVPIPTCTPCPARPDWNSASVISRSSSSIAMIRSAWVSVFEER